MASSSSKFNLCTLSFFILICSVQSKLNLYTPDSDVLLEILKDLGMMGHEYSPEKSCNFVGIFCEWKMSNTSLYMLRVTRIIFNSHQLRGSISPSIGKLLELKELSLPNNMLVGHIPPQLTNCQKLRTLNLQNNRLSGKVPSELSSLIYLQFLDLSFNKFSGNLNFLMNFSSLQKLSLANNSFAGNIPPFLTSFKNLQEFNISGNRLLRSSELELNQIDHSPSELARKNPKRYILQENLAWTIQTSTIAPAVNDLSANNDKLSSEDHKHQKNKTTIGTWIFWAGTLAGGFSGLFFSVFLVLVVFQHRRDQKKAVKKPKYLTTFHRLITPEQMAFLKEANVLASLQVIGRGACGDVYLAKLPESDMMVAIKKITQPPKDARELREEDSKLLDKKMRQIRQEIETVGLIRHRNLLPLLAHVPRPDCHFLVYEYMQNGSLQDVILQVLKGERELCWSYRHQIALGIATGLEYLHTEINPCIVHRDLKPANILLDDNMEARIADFGLSKAFPQLYTHVTTCNVKGTPGYIAPEYHETLMFSDKSDIYSFGVLLAALVIGKLPTDEFFQHTDELIMVKWLRNVLSSNDPRRAIDPKLIGNGNEEVMLLVLKIACACTSDDPNERPNSRDLKAMLKLHSPRLATRKA